MWYKKRVFKLLRPVVVCRSSFNGVISAVVWRRVYYRSTVQPVVPARVPDGRTALLPRVHAYTGRPLPHNAGRYPLTSR